MTDGEPWIKHGKQLNMKILKDDPLIDAGYDETDAYCRPEEQRLRTAHEKENCQRLDKNVSLEYYVLISYLGESEIARQ